MAFDTGGAAAGAAQGFAVAGPWGALAGGVIGGIMGGKAKKKAKKAGRMQKLYMAEAMKQIKLQNEINEQNWKFYQENVYPMEMQDAEAMRTGAEQGAPEPLSRRYRDRASTDVMQMFQKQRDMTKRQNLQAGIDPSSGRSQALEQQAAVKQGAAEAGAVTKAGERASEDWRGRREAFMAQHRGKSGEVYSRRGEQAQTAANLAGFYGDKQGQALQAGAEKTEAFMGAVGTAKDLYGAYQNQQRGQLYGADGGEPQVNEAIAGGYDMRSAEGGAITGPGGPVDDQVPAELPEGSYVIPADVVSAVGVDFFDKLEAENAEGGAEGMQNRVNAMTSDGEYVISENVVKRKGKKFFDDLLAKYHKPAAEQSKQYQSKTEKTNDAGGAKQQFMTAANGYKGGLNTTAPAGPTSRHYQQGGYLSANVTEQPPTDPGQQSFQYGGQGTSYGYDAPDKPQGGYWQTQTPWARQQYAQTLQGAKPSETFEANPMAAQQGDIGTGAGQGDRISQWSARRAHIMGQQRYATDVAAATGPGAGTNVQAGIAQEKAYASAQQGREGARADGGPARRERFSKGVRKDGGHTGGVDTYQGTYKDGKVPITAGVGEGNLGGGGPARAYQDGDQVGRRGGKSLKEGGYSANRTSLGVAEKPKGTTAKDGGPTKKKTRRGGKKHKFQIDKKRWAPKDVFKQDGGAKVEIKPLNKKDGGPTKAKAKKMLRDDQAQGKKLTSKQKGYFGAVAGGNAYKQDGGVAYWKPGDPGRPKPGDKGPPPKPIRGDYSGTDKPKDKAVKTRVYKGEPGSKPYGEE